MSCNFLSLATWSGLKTNHLCSCHIYCCPPDRYYILFLSKKHFRLEDVSLLKSHMEEPWAIPILCTCPIPILYAIAIWSFVLPAQVSQFNITDWLLATSQVICIVATAVTLNIRHQHDRSRSYVDRWPHHSSKTSTTTQLHLVPPLNFHLCPLKWPSMTILGFVVQLIYIYISIWYIVI